MFKTYEGARGRRLQAVGAALGSTALVTFVGLVPPGQAVAQQVETYESNRYRGYCLEGGVADGTFARTSRCRNEAKQKWRVIGRGRSHTGHRLVMLRTGPRGAARYCLDSDGLPAGRYNVVVRRCNRNDEWQIWEVFRNGNGAITFKSWGAYTRQNNQHLCMKARGRGYTVGLRECNARGRPQQWR